MLTKLIFRNLIYNWGTSLLSVLLLSTGVGIISFLITVGKQVENKFNNDLKDIDMVVGAKGSPLQLVLSAVYHMDAPTGNIKMEEVEQVLKNPMIEQAIPLAYGDNFEGYRIVGTEKSYLLKYGARFAKGRMFNEPMEVVLGSNVAKIKKMRVGNFFLGTHGLSKESGDLHKHFNYKVTGILEPSGCVLDNLILTPVETVWMVHHEHAKEDTHDHHADHEEQERHTHYKEENEEDTEQQAVQEITALLLKFRSPQAMFVFPRMISESTNMQAAVPSLEINRLMGLLGMGTNVVKAIAGMLIAVAGLSIFISLYNRMKEKKYELALARSLGCSKLRIFTIVLFESLLLCIAGFIAGLALCLLSLYALQLGLEEEHLFNIDLKNFWIIDQLLLFVTTISLGMMAAFIPSLKAYHLNISKTLAHA